MTFLGPAPADDSIGALDVSSASGQTAFPRLFNVVPIPQRDDPRERKACPPPVRKSLESRPRSRHPQRLGSAAAPLASANATPYNRGRISFSTGLISRGSCCADPRPVFSLQGLGPLCLSRQSPTNAGRPLRANPLFFFSSGLRDGDLLTFGSRPIFAHFRGDLSAFRRQFSFFASRCLCCLHLSSRT